MILGSFTVQAVALVDSQMYFTSSCLHPIIRAIILNYFLVVVIKKKNRKKKCNDYIPVNGLWKTAAVFPLLLCGVCNAHSSASLRRP